MFVYVCYMSVTTTIYVNLLRAGAPFTDMAQLKSQHGYVILFILKCVMK